jgi:hypothetical protein
MSIELKYGPALSGKQHRVIHTRDTTEYTKSLSSDFGGNLILNQFHHEIEADTGITTTFKGLTQTLDDVMIIFDSVLSGGELTTLEALISAHVPDTAAKRVYAYRVYPEERKIKSTNWSMVGSFEYPGTIQNGNVVYIDVISAINSSSETYDIYISARGDNSSLGEGTFGNTELKSNELNLFAPFPSNKDIIEILVRSTDRKKTVNIQEIIFWYEID